MANLPAPLTIALLLCAVLTCTARPEPPFHATNSPADVRHLDEIRAKLDDVTGEESCGVEDEDCLMRRTLAAHIDYIYTQKKNP